MIESTTKAGKFKDRSEGGRQLARLLQKYAGREDVVVLALGRGGVPVAYEISKALRVAMDIFIVRKLMVPGHEATPIGAVASGDVCVLNRDIISELHVPESTVHRITLHEVCELENREKFFRGTRPPPLLENKTIILADDGVTTGTTLRSAIEALSRRHPQRLVIAVPVASLLACEELAKLTDELIALQTPATLGALADWYEDFSPLADVRVQQILQLYWASQIPFPTEQSMLPRTTGYPA